MRQKLQTRTLPTIKPPDAKQTLKFASFNVNGLDLEVGWTIQQLLQTRGYDVSIKPPNQKSPKTEIKTDLIINSSPRFWVSLKPMEELTSLPSSTPSLDTRSGTQNVLVPKRGAGALPCSTVMLSQPISGTVHQEREEMAATWGQVCIPAHIYSLSEQQERQLYTMESRFIPTCDKRSYYPQKAGFMLPGHGRF